VHKQQAVIDSKCERSNASSLMVEKVLMLVAVVPSGAQKVLRRC
jgi:hypothetical protein